IVARTRTQSADALFRPDTRAMSTAACPRCGEETPDRARFCLACGAALGGQTRSPVEVRKTVAVLFCDVTGSTALGEQQDPEQVRRVMSRYFVQACTVLERHGGTVE